MKFCIQNDDVCIENGDVNANIKDGTGTLDFREVKQLCHRLGKNMTDEECHKALLEMDEDGSMEADAEEFVSWWISNADSNAVLREEIVQ